MISIQKATYLDGFRLSIDFTDGINKIIDFQPFLETIQHGFLEKYKKPSFFKKFFIEDGNLVWGKDWDIIFPIIQLYKGKIKI